MGETHEQKKEAPQEAPKQPEEKEHAPTGPRTGVPINETPKEGEQKDPEKKEQTVTSGETYDLEGQLSKLKNMSNEELMTSLFTQLGEVIKLFAEEGALERLFGLGGPTFTPQEMADIKVDVEAAEQKEYDEESTNKAVEFVCNALNLPAKKNVMALWYSLRSSEGAVYEHDKNMFKEGEVNVGDVLFFRKEGESQPYLSAIVTDAGQPMRMKYMQESGEVKEEEIIGSALFDQEWFGYVKLPEKPEENPSP